MTTPKTHAPNDLWPTVTTLNLSEDSALVQWAITTTIRTLRDLDAAELTDDDIEQVEP